MIEPYGTTQYEFSGLELLKLHKAISPYGVCNGYETQSILCVKQINRKVLLEIRDKIDASLVHLPERNVVTQDERHAAKSANPTAILLNMVMAATSKNTTLIIKMSKTSP